MKKFKICDRIAILGQVVGIYNKNDTYQIVIKIDNSTSIITCTREGKYRKNDTQQNVYHLEDLQCIHGKEMYISSVDKDYSNTAYVIGKSNNGNYLAIHMKDLSNYKNGKTVALYQFKYAYDKQSIPNIESTTDMIKKHNLLIAERDALLNKLANVLILINQNNGK